MYSGRGCPTIRVFKLQRLVNVQKFSTVRVNIYCDTSLLAAGFFLDTPSQSSGLSGGEITAAVFGFLALFALFGGLVYILFRPPEPLKPYVLPPGAASQSTPGMQFTKGPEGGVVETAGTPTSLDNPVYESGVHYQLGRTRERVLKESHLNALYRTFSVLCSRILRAIIVIVMQLDKIDKSKTCSIIILGRTFSTIQCEYAVYRSTLLCKKSNEKHV